MMDPEKRRSSLTTVTSAPKKICVRNSNATAEDWRKISEKMTTDQKNQYMLEHGILTDCTFVVGPEEGETKEFQAHRFLLCNASAVFEKMLTGEMVEAKTGSVRVTDLSPNTFQLLLRCIYGEDPEMTTFQETQEFASAAHKYQMKLLLEHGVTRMGALIEPENIWTAFEIADLLQNERLKNFCIQALQRDTLRCVADPGFMQASEENVALLLEQDELNMFDEQLLVNIIVHWARHEARKRGLSDDDSGVRAVLEPRLLSLFRFLAMSSQQFMLGPGLAGWLTSDEKDEVYKCLLTKDFSKLPQYFSSVAKNRKNVIDVKGAAQIPEGMLPPGNFICKRDIIETRPNMQQIEFQFSFLIFKVSSRCKLQGFQCSSLCRVDDSVDPTAFKAKKPIYHEKTQAAVFVFNHTLAMDFKLRKIAETTYERKDTEYNSTISIMFKGPVSLVPDNWFAVSLKLERSLDDHIPGEYPNPSRAQSVCTAAGVEFTFHTEKLEGYRTSVRDGVFEALIFSI